PGAPQRRQCAVHPAGDHRHRGGGRGGSSGCQGVPGKGRGLSRLPVCAGDVRDDRCSGVSGLPP
ncbi:Inhibitor of sigma-G Gin, partial [Dysosmobacter welbionis]